MNEYNTASDDFATFKKEVLQSYPGATDEERGTLRELKRLFKNKKDIDSDNLDEYMRLVRRFRAIKRELNPPATGTRTATQTAKTAARAR